MITEHAAPASGAHACAGDVITEGAVLAATRLLTAGSVATVSALELTRVSAPARRAHALAVHRVALGAVLAVTAKSTVCTVRARRAGYLATHRHKT